MIIGIPKEIMKDENRVAAIPETVQKLKSSGFEVVVEQGAGKQAYHADADYEKAGARIESSAAGLYQRADIILKVKEPMVNRETGTHEIDLMKQGTILVTFLHPAAPGNLPMVHRLQGKNITAFTMDGIPRITRAQRMDALSSMSAVTGYKSVLIAAMRLPVIIPLMGTAIGTLKPARFLIVGCGVVGLQAIATAKRLGAQVTAVDIRPNAREEAASLGASVAGFDVPGDLALGEGGYARALPESWLLREREALQPLLEKTDAVILSALVPGEEAPIVITREMMAAMKPGSVIVDVAIDQGGNCQATVPGEETWADGRYVCGIKNIPGSVASHSSWLYAHNILHFVNHVFPGGKRNIDRNDEIVKSSLVTVGGEIVHKGVIKALAGRSMA